MDIFEVDRTQVNSFYQAYKRETTIYTIKTRNELKQFLSSKRMPENMNEFHAINPKQWFVIKEYDQPGKDEEGAIVACTGFVITCKTMLNNIRNCLESQPSGLWVYVDGTYR